MKIEFIEKQAAIEALGEEPEVWSTDNEWDMGAQEQWRFDHAAIEAIQPADVRPVVRGRREIEMAEMTLNEAIEHAKEVAKTSCGDCAKEHGRLAGWLEELVAFKRVAPTPADVRPVVRGRWEWNEDDGHCYCTVCGSVSPESDQNGDECDCPNFCPHCGSHNGADMRDIEDKEPVDKFEGWSDELKQAYREMLEKLNLLGVDDE